MPTTTPFNNLITFSRGSNATVTGPNGLIQWAASNNATFSEQFDNAAWTKNSSSIAANVTTAPDGTRTADTWTPTSNGNTGAVRLLGTFTIPVGPNATTSIYVKSAGKRWVYMTTPAALSPLHNCWFDLQTGAVGTMGSGVLAATMTAVGDGWYRISTTSATTLATNYVFLSATDADNSTTVVSDGTGVHIWGAQLELGSTATTYNPTTVKNLLGFSEAFDNAAWTKSNSSIVTGAQANPVNGLFNAQKLMEDTVAAVPHGFASANVTTIIGTPMTSAFYAKAAGRSWVVANAFNAANKRCWFDLANGTAGTTAAGCTTSITSVGNGWYRCAIIQTAAATTMSLGLYAATADGVLSYTGDGNSGVYIYGAHLSDSASLDPYVPTPGAAPSSTAFYGPRFDFDPVTLLPRGLLVEEQRTNSLTNSEDWSNAVWSKNSVTISTNATAAPSGGLTADKIIPDASGVGFFSEQAFSVTAGTTYTASIFLKAAEISSGISIILGTGGLWPSGNPNITVNLANGTITSSGGVSASSIINFGNGWYRVTLTQTASVTGTSSLRISPTSGLAGNGINGIFIWGAQVEAGAFATSYIPTVASTVTRSADVATISGQNFAQWYRQDAGSFVVDADSYTVSTTDFVLTASDGTSNNRFGLYRSSPNIGGYVVTGNVTQMDLTRTPVAANTPYRAAVAATLNDGNTALNGSLAAGDTSITMGTLDRLSIGANNGAGFISGHIRNIRYIPARAADFQIQALST